MPFKNKDELSEEIIEGIAALPSVIPYARITILNAANTYSKAKQRQLNRELSRAKKRGDKGNAMLIEKKLISEGLRNQYILIQKQREEMTPVTPEKGQVVIQGRVTLNGYGVDCHLVSLVNEKGSLLQKVTTNKSGGFTLIDDSGSAYAIKVSNKEGKVLYQHTKLGLSQDNPKLYLEIELSNIDQGCDIKEPPHEDPKKEVEVPNLTGHELSLAKEMLNKLKLNLKVMGSMISDKHIAQIIKQDPKAGKKVEIRSAVKVWIHESKKDIEKVDEFIGKSIHQAAKLVDANKLYSLDKIEFQKSDQPGIVMSQIPAPGEPLKDRAKISLKVGVGDDEKDLATARLLLDRNEEFQKLKITQSKLTKVLKERKVQGLTDLRKLSRTSMKVLTTTFGLSGINEARTLKAILVDVTNQLKG